MNIFSELKLNDDSIIKLTFTMERLYKLQSTNPDVYEKFCKFIFDGTGQDLISYYHAIYACYLMANQDKELTINSFEKFLHLTDGLNMQEIVDLANSLTTSKKK